VNEVDSNWVESGAGSLKMDFWEGTLGLRGIGSPQIQSQTKAKPRRFKPGFLFEQQR